MRKILSYLRIGLTAGVGVVYYNLRYFRKFAKHPDKYPFDYRYRIVRKMVRFVLKHFHVDYKVDGFNNFSDLNQKCLIVSNHHSDADPLIMNVLRALEAFSLDRDNLMNQISQIRDIVAHLKDETKPNLIVYIEGTRNKHPENGCLQFHAGTLKISKMANVPVVPVTIFGTNRILSGKSYLRKYPAFVEYMRKIEYFKYEDFDTNLEAANLRKQFDKRLDEIRQKDLDYVYAQHLTKRRKALETIIDIKRLS